MTRPWLAAGLLAAGLSPARESPPRRPNVVVILADDQGWGDLGLHGNTNLATPHIDSLGRDGAAVRHFYVSPVCAPTRAEFLTGRYYPRTGVHGTSARAERMNLDEKTIAEVFRAAGYATGAFGKWQDGSQSPYHPNARGFDSFYGFTQGHLGHYFDAALEEDGWPVRGRGFVADDLTDRALEFVERNRARPFLCYVAYNTPHSPMQVPDRFYDRFARAELPLRASEPGREDLAHTRAALAMVENLDWNVGRLLARLNALSLARDTVVLYFSDNGPNGHRWNGGLKGLKGSVDEGGIRSPLLVRWPGRIRPGTTVVPIAAAVDLLPTLAELARVPVVGTKPLDGRSLAPLLLGRAADWPERRLFAFRGRGEVSVRTQRFRLDPQGRLFDIEADSGQEKDVAGVHPGVAAELRRAAEVMEREVFAGEGRDDRPLPVGHARRTELTAGDATFAGSVAPQQPLPEQLLLHGMDRYRRRAHLGRGGGAGGRIRSRGAPCVSGLGRRRHPRAGLRGARGQDGGPPGARPAPHRGRAGPRSPPGVVREGLPAPRAGHPRAGRGAGAAHLAGRGHPGRAGARSLVGGAHAPVRSRPALPAAP